MKCYSWTHYDLATFYGVIDFFSKLDQPWAYSLTYQTITWTSTDRSLTWHPSVFQWYCIQNSNIHIHLKLPFAKWWSLYIGSSVLMLNCLSLSQNLKKHHKSLTIVICSNRSIGLNGSIGNLLSVVHIYWRFTEIILHSFQYWALRNVLPASQPAITVSNAIFDQYMLFSHEMNYHNIIWPVCMWRKS